MTIGRDEYVVKRLREIGREPMWNDGSERQSDAEFLRAQILDLVATLEAKGHPAGMSRTYQSKEDFDIAQAWMKTHEKADEILYGPVKQHVLSDEPGPMMALAAVYFEPVSQHYLGSRLEAIKFLKQLSRSILSEADGEDTL